MNKRGELVLYSFLTISTLNMYPYDIIFIYLYGFVLHVICNTKNPSKRSPGLRSDKYYWG